MITKLCSNAAIPWIYIDGIITHMNKDIQAYNKSKAPDEQAICDLLAKEINSALPEAESKIWHRNPVWFLDGNPVAGYAALKDSVQLVFWSGQDFDESGLHAEGTFKAAQARYQEVNEVNVEDLNRWLAKSRDIQWDYKNIVKHKGKLERIK